MELIANHIISKHVMHAVVRSVQMLKAWIQSRTKERTSWDGAMLIAVGLMILFMAPLAKIAAGIAIVYGAWTIWKSE